MALLSPSPLNQLSGDCCSKPKNCAAENKRFAFELLQFGECFGEVEII